MREVFTAGDVASVHLKDAASGPGGFPAFAAGILTSPWPTPAAAVHS